MLGGGTLPGRAWVAALLATSPSRRVSCTECYLRSRAYSHVGAMSEARFFVILLAVLAGAADL